MALACVFCVLTMGIHRKNNQISSSKRFGSDAWNFVMYVYWSFTKSVKMKVSRLAQPPGVLGLNRVNT